MRWLTALAVLALASAQTSSGPFLRRVYKSSRNRAIQESLRFETFLEEYLVSNPSFTKSSSTPPPSSWLSNSDYFGLKQSVKFTPATSGDYTFAARCDDGCKIFIDGQSVLPSNSYRYQGPRLYKSAPIPMVAGQSYEYLSTFFQGTGGAVITLQYAKGTESLKAMSGSEFSAPDGVLQPVKYNGVEYAVLSGTDPFNKMDGSCQDGYVALPDGWSFSNNTAETRELLSRFTFGTSCIVFMGTGSPASVYVGTASRGLPQSDAARCSGFRTDTRIRNGKVEYFPATCAAETLIQRPARSSSAPDYGSVSALGEPIAFEGKLYVPLGGADAASPANFESGCELRPYKIPSGYQIAQATAHTFAAIAGSRHRFGARCVVLADGKYYDTQTAGACTGLSGADGIVRDSSNNAYYYPRACPARILLESIEQRPASTHRDLGCMLERRDARVFTANRRLSDLTPATCAAYCRSQNKPYGAMFSGNSRCYCADEKPRGGDTDASECCVPCAGNTALTCGGLYDSSRRVWPATVIEVGYVNTNFSSSWDTSPTLAASVIRAKYIYGTLDNASPQECTAGCQGVSYQIPSGWELVPANDPDLVDVLQANAFATECYVVADGSAVYSDGSSCGSAVLTTYTVSGSVFHAVSKCNSRILVRKARPTDVTATCAAASGTGDPHYKTFDGKRYTNHDEGEHVLVAPVGTPTGYDADYNNWRVHAIQRRAPPTRAGVNEAIIIKQHNTVLGVYLKNTNLTDPFQIHTPTGEIALTNNQWHEVGTAGTADHVRFYFRTGSGSSRRWGPRYSTWSYADFRLASGIRVVVRSGMWHISYLNTYFYLPNRWLGTTEGLLGNCDGVATNDFRLPAPSSAIATSQSAFVSAYKVGNNGITSIAPLPVAPSSGAGAAFAGCSEASTAVQALARDACATVSSAPIRQQCEFDVCATGDADAAADAIRNAATERDLSVVGNSTCTNIATSQLQTFTRYGRTYALLDGSAATATTTRCTLNSYTVPDGWSVARDHPVNRALLPCYTWGGGCVVFNNGKAYDSNLRLCGEDQLRLLAPAASAPDALCYGTRQRNRHVLLVKDETALSMTNGDFADFTTGTGAVAGWQSWPEGSAQTYTRGANDNTVTPLDGAIRIETTTASERKGVVQQLTVSRTESFSISAWAKSEAVADGVTGDYSLYVDVSYTNGRILSYFVDFSPGTKPWHRRAVDVSIPAGWTTSTIRVHLLLRNRVGVAHFSNVVIDIPTGQSYNYVKDPMVAEARKSEWIDYFNGWEESTDDVSAPEYGATSSIRVDSVTATDKAGAYQGIQVGKAIGGLYVAGFSKASAAGSRISPDYSLYTDVTYLTGDPEYGLVAPFPAKTEWNMVDRVFPMRSTVVESLSFNVLYRNQPANTRAFFDDLWVLESCESPMSGDGGLNGRSYGDPHLVSVAGRAYDIQTPGEYTLVDADYISVQGRFELAGNRVASVVTAAAIRCGAENGGMETVIEIKRNPDGAGKDPHVRISPAAARNDPVVTLAAGASISNDRGVTVSRSGALATGPITYTVKCKVDEYTATSGEDPEGTSLPLIQQRTHTVRVVVLESESRVQFLQLDFAPERDSAGASLAPCDGLLCMEKGARITRPNGNSFEPKSQADIERVLGGDWRNTNSLLSFFTYNVDEKDKSGPAAYYDSSFKAPTPEDFTEAQRSAANATCAKLSLSSALQTACYKDALYLSANSGAEANSFTTVAYGQASVDSRADGPIETDGVSPAALPTTAFAAVVVAALATLTSRRL